MQKVTVEFFHDVICSFCFPMSYRMRQLEKVMPEVEIIHRSFALVRDEGDFDIMFGSREAAKQEILGHWEHANQNDDLHRFNIEGMREADFPFPSSMKGLIACKAAFFIGGNSGYWNVFDALQNALFVQSRNIGEQAVIDEIIRKTNIDFEQWKRHYLDPSTKEAVESDFYLVRKYNINSVPSLVINGEHLVRGAQPLPKIINAIYTASSEEETNNSGPGVCRLDGDKVICD
jgi:predicted DsbA family dithiol-disulfide isomerase